jgi:ketosteroid isomerase-like protein
MSQENVEVVRASFEVWNAADWDAYRELLDPNIMVKTVEDWPEAGAYVGRDAVVQFFKQIREAWTANELELIGDSIHAADRVVQRFVWHGAGRGPDAQMGITGVYTIRKRKIAVQEFFWDHAEALEAVGLSEQDAQADS